MTVSVVGAASKETIALTINKHLNGVVNWEVENGVGKSQF
jgi:hypothetical protein